MQSRWVGTAMTRSLQVWSGKLPDKLRAKSLWPAVVQSHLLQPRSWVGRVGGASIAAGQCSITIFQVRIRGGLAPDFTLTAGMFEKTWMCWAASTCAKCGMNTWSRGPAA